jgi:FtsH-binding integral membrane protein
MSMDLDYQIAAQARSSERVAFIRRTYGHLAGAILAFACIEAALFHFAFGFVQATVGTMLMQPVAWLFVIGAFMVVSWIATAWAQSDTSPGMQYMGLGLYVVAEAVIFLPLLFIATQVPQFAEGHILEKAAVMTLAVFAGLTLAVFLSGKDYSALGTYLSVGGMIAFGLIVASILFGFDLGLFFCFAMVALASGCIIYQTSNVIHKFRTDQHVAAALTLFAAVALLFYYILIIFLRMSRR